MSATVPQITVTPTEPQTLAVLRSVLAQILPPGTPIVRTQTNRVPEPKAQDWVALSPTTRVRLRTNIDNFDDCFFAGYVSGCVLTVSHVYYGTIVRGAPLLGLGVAAGSVITGPISASGGVGTYAVAPEQDVSGVPLAAGTFRALLGTELGVQIDVHGPASSENAQIISTLLRDQWACDAFNAIDDRIQPLYADDPRELVFENAEAQYERRWSVDAKLQVDTTVQVPQQFADALVIGIISVDAKYPPT